MNSSLSTNLETVLVEYLTPLCPFAASVSGASDPRHAEEAQYGIIGQYLPVPAVIVTVMDGQQVFRDNPCLGFQVSVKLRSSSYRTLVATHNANAIILADALWDPEAIADAFASSESLVLAGYMHQGQSPMLADRALTTDFTMQFKVTSKG